MDFAKKTREKFKEQDDGQEARMRPIPAALEEIRRRITVLDVKTAKEDAEQTERMTSTRGDFQHLLSRLMEAEGATARLEKMEGKIAEGADSQARQAARNEVEKALGQIQEEVKTLEGKVKEAENMVHVAMAESHKVEVRCASAMDKVEGRTMQRTAELVERKAQALLLTCNEEVATVAK